MDVGNRGRGKTLIKLSLITIFCCIVASRLQVWEEVIWPKNIYNLWNGRLFGSRDSPGKGPWFPS